MHILPERICSANRSSDTGSLSLDFLNLDMQQISEEDQIDVLSPVYQKEIELIANKLAKFRPDAIVIEHPVTGQPKVDNL